MQSLEQLESRMLLTTNVSLDFGPGWETNLNAAAAQASVAPFTDVELRIIQETIQWELEDAYHGYDVSFGANLSTFDDLIDFNAVTNNPGELGFSDDLDFRNVNQSTVEVYAASFAFVMTSPVRNTLIRDVISEVSITAIHELGHSYGATHVGAYGDPQITPATYANTGGVQNTHFMATDWTGYNAANPATSFSNWSRATFEAGQGLLPNPVNVAVNEPFSFIDGIGDSPATATPIPLTTAGLSGMETAVATGWINTVGDVDVFSFAANEGDLFSAQIWSEVPGNTAFVDSLLTLVDTNGTTILAQNDDAHGDGNTFNSGTFRTFDPIIINVPIPADGTYFLVADGFGTDTGHYELLMGLDAVDPTPQLFTEWGTSFNTQRPNLQWNATTDADHYTVWLNNMTTSHYNMLVGQTFDANSYTPPTDLPLGHYRVWVQAFDSNNVASNWSSGVDFWIGTPPTLTSQLDVPNGLAERRPTFTWTDVDGASKYELWVNHVGVQNAYIREQNLTGTSFTPLQDMQEGTYEFWVRAADADGTWGNWSESVKFDVNYRTVITAPVGSSGTNVVFQWQDVGAQSYRIWVDPAGSNNTPIIDVSGLTTTSYSATLAVGSYDMWIQTYDSLGALKWSQKVTFDVVSLAPAESDTPDEDDGTLPDTLEPVDDLDAEQLVAFALNASPMKGRESTPRVPTIITAATVVVDDTADAVAAVRSDPSTGHGVDHLISPIRDDAAESMSLESIDDVMALISEPTSVEAERLSSSDFDADLNAEFAAGAAIALSRQIPLFRRKKKSPYLCAGR